MNLLTAGALFDQIVDKEGVLYKKVALYDTYPAQYNPVQLNDVACYDSAKDVVHAHANPVNPLMSLRTLGRLKIEQYNMRQLFLFHKIPLRERALLNFYNQDAVLLTASLTVRECEGYKNEHDIYHSFITKLFRDTPLAHPKKTSSANP